MPLSWAISAKSMGAVDRLKGRFGRIDLGHETQVFPLLCVCEQAGG